MLYTILMSLYFFFSYPTLECTDVKEGSFYMNLPTQGEEVIPISIDRKGNYQIESVEAFDFSIEYKVKWIDDCTYTLEFSKVMKDKFNNYQENKSEIITVQIIKVQEDYYLQTSSSNLREATIEAKVFINHAG